MIPKSMNEAATVLCRSLKNLLRELRSDLRVDLGRGQPTKYSAAIGEEIASIISQGIPLAEVMRQLDCLSYECVRQWQKRHPEFAKLIEAARVAGFENYGRWRLGIAEDTIENKLQWREAEAKELCGQSNWQLLRSWDPKRWKAILVAQVRCGSDEGE